ncbi:MAG: hypothetical protein N3A38_13645 [Planctomycetota bacterium]|nr:hypothetical protein [Planctomycetota bacterium]
MSRDTRDGHLRLAGKVERHCREIERCNQRGGRMLSIVDLMRAGTVDSYLAAYLFSLISAGHSFLVGCVPGGGGKTTVMGALLNLVPPDVELYPADGVEAMEDAARNPAPRRCMICHEIGPGGYYAYLWGAEARAFFSLTGTGHMIATNLHADTIGQCREQLCGALGIPAPDFDRVALKIFLAVGWKDRMLIRRVAAVYESDPSGGRGDPRPVFTWDAQKDRFERTGESRLSPPEREMRLRSFLEKMDTCGMITIEQVREAILSDPG